MWSADASSPLTLMETLSFMLSNQQTAALFLLPLLAWLPHFSPCCSGYSYRLVSIAYCLGLRTPAAILTLLLVAGSACFSPLDLLHRLTRLFFWHQLWYLKLIGIFCNIFLFPNLEINCCFFHPSYCLFWLDFLLLHIGCYWCSALSTAPLLNAFIERTVSCVVTIGCHCDWQIHFLVTVGS